MNPNDLADSLTAATTGDVAEDGVSLMSPLMGGAARVGMAGDGWPIHGVLVGELLAIAGEDAKPLVRFAGPVGERVVPARSSVDLHAAHIGHGVVLVFEQGDAARPIVTGVLRDAAAGWPLTDKPAQIDVDTDGQRLVVSAKEQLVLRCGKASITLTKAGKVLVEGSYLLSRSTGVNRIKGGSVQLN